MSCKEVMQILPSFLSREVNPFERELIQSHLAACADCQNELRILVALQGRVRKSLYNQAAGADPSPQVWSRLQAQLDFSACADRPTMRLSWLPRWKQNLQIGVLTMKQTVSVTMAVLALIAGTFAFVPGVRAAILENVTGWLGYDFPSPDSQTILSWGSNWGFTPYNPRYVPDGLHIKGSMVGGETLTEKIGLCYQPEERQPGDPFIVVRETHLTAPGALPVGKAVNVNGKDGVMDELPAGKIEWCPGPFSVEEELVPVYDGEEPGSPQQISADETLSYGQALRLTFFMDDLRIEIFGLYPEKELIRIAKSLVPVERAENQPGQPSQP